MISPAASTATGTERESFSLRGFRPTNRRKILCAFPRYSYSFGTFNHAFPLMGDVKGFMPPQGILLITALIPEQWEVRFVDENIRQITPEEFAWADAVFVSGMHIQRQRIHDITRRAHKAGKVVALGGPSVSSAPEYYPDADLLHCGEVGDGTLRLFKRLDETVQRPSQQIVYRTVERLPMVDFPTPAYHRINLRDYLLGSVQFSSGCPFTCEFCDIPALYGRNPRLKSPEQIVRELDQLADGGCVSVYFVDDNFIGNPKATAELLPHLIEWQKRRDYYVRLSCEATLNMATHTKVLEQMREAGFNNVFFGIETPEPRALKAMKKGQNLRTPILEAIATVNRYGIEAASGIIMGLDTDTDETPQAIIDFAQDSNIPIMTVNILYALPNTALYERLQKEDRVLNDASDRDSNIVFLQPYDTVVSNWKRVIAKIFSPADLYARYTYNAVHTYPNRIKPKYPLRQATWANIKRALSIFRRIIWRVGIRSDSRRHFWKMAWTELRQGNVETMFQVAMVAHHLITYARECTQGKMQSSNYSIRQVEEDRENEILAAA
ncbi:MAG: B12-binding domain-containing radical SAM protein [Methylacidiphilales bacterium]|nr:B12-binding domain-containing radical SAM protein [Candidatus Methylacidiphilales bacterium]